MKPLIIGLAAATTLAVPAADGGQEVQKHLLKLQRSSPFIVLYFSHLHLIFDTLSHFDTDLVVLGMAIMASVVKPVEAASPPTAIATNGRVETVADTEATNGSLPGFEKGIQYMSQAMCVTCS